MLKKNNRLSKRSDFVEIRVKGKMAQSPLFGLNYLFFGEEKKFGFIISKKISKRAVDRNKMKRLLAEGVRLNLNEIKIGMRAVFLAKKDLLGVKFEEVEKEVERIFRLINN